MKSARDPESYAIKTWSLKRSAAYGSKHYDEKPAKVMAAQVSPDGKTVTLDIADMSPTWRMKIRYAIRAADGLPVQGAIRNTIHQLGNGR